MALVLLVGGIAGCDNGGGGKGAGGETEPPAPRLAINERNGTVKGVGIGDPQKRIERVFGDPAPYSAPPRGFAYPLGTKAGEPTFPGSTPTPPGRMRRLRYHGVSFFSVSDEILDVIVTSERATTRRGLRPGDPLDRVEELYPELECGETDVGADAPIFEPACWGRMKRGVHIWIGGDPINNIELSALPLRPRS